MSKKEGNIFDKIMKESIEAILFPIVVRRFGLNIKTLEVLDPKLQITVEREVGFLRKVTTSQGQEFILHLEFQTTNDPEMVYRILEYHGMLVRKYRLPIHHILIYLGQKKMTMKTDLPTDLIFSRFEVLDFSEIDHKELLSSQIPEEIILAVLGDKGNVDPEKVVLSIFKKLKQVTEHQHDLRKFINQLHVWSKLRNLEATVIKTNAQMPIHIKATDYKMYNDGVAEGRKQAEETIEKAILKLLLSNKFTPEEIADILGVSIGLVARIGKNNSL